MHRSLAVALTAAALGLAAPAGAAQASEPGQNAEKGDRPGAVAKIVRELADSPPVLAKNGVDNH